MEQNVQEMEPFRWRTHHQHHCGDETCPASGSMRTVSSHIQPAALSSIQMLQPWLGLWSAAGTSGLAQLTGLCYRSPPPLHTAVLWSTSGWGKTPVDKWIRFIGGADPLQRARCQRSHRAWDCAPCAASRWEETDSQSASAAQLWSGR